MCLAVPGEVLEIRDRLGMRFADVRFGAITREVCLHLQPDAAPGDFVLVHVGLAISIIDRERAREALELLERLGELDGVDEDQGAAPEAARAASRATRE